MSVRHAAGAVFKAFAANVAVFFVRMADFALTVIRVTRNMVAVMMFMSAAARFIMAVLVFQLMAVLMPALDTVFMVMMATAASPIFMMMVMRAHLIAAVSYIR
jgi:hypothetical protein